MNQRNSRTYLWLAVLLMSGYFLARDHAAAQDTCITAKCHAELLNAANVHPVAETCDMCHQSVDESHPKKGKETFKLVQEPPDMCYLCHEAFGEKSQVHFPVAQGMCTTCHDPHASDQPKLLAQPLAATCEACHPGQADFEVVHGPVSAGACTACHSPHESDNDALLLQPGEEVCFGCHLDLQDVLKKENVHTALLGGCTSCHNPHGAAHPKLLAEEGQQLCFLCHPDIGEKVEESPVVHTAVLIGCPTCHSPHASDNAKLLLNPQKETCLGCHDGILSKDMTVFHGPINDGQCAPCHDPHGAQHPKLLINEFPTAPYVPYTGAEFAFCFSCHKRDLLQYPDTSFATNFRDGERNLHYVHVNNKQKGRSCRLCHNLHGGKNPKLLADTVPFGKWSLPLNFVKTDTGGGCSPGCHKPKYYDRKSPGRKPKAAKSAG